MSNVRDYFRNREKRKNNEGISYKEKIRSHKLAYFYRTVLLLILLAGTLVFLVFQWNNKIFSEGAIVSSAEVHITQGATAERLGKNILIYSKDGASCMDEKGDVLWNQTFEMQNPQISICEEIVAIGDYNGSSIYVMSASQIMGEINTDTPIHSFCVAANGMVAVILENGNTTKIRLYAVTSGEMIAEFNTSMKNSGYPIAVSLSPNGKLVCVSYTYVDSGVLKSSVAFYNFGRVGQNENEYYMSGYNYLDTVVPYVQFISNDAAFGVSDDRIMFFSGDERPASVKENMLNEEVQSIYYNKEYIGLVFHDTSGEALYRLDVYNKAGTLILSKNFNIEYSDIVFYKDQIIVYNDMECVVINENGLEKYVGTFQKTAMLMIPISSYYKYALVSAEAIDIIELK